MVRPPQDELQQTYSRVCQALADPKRMCILYVLNDAPMYVSQIAETLQMPQPTVSRHLAILKQRGIVRGQRQGSSVIYHLHDPRVITVIDLMREIATDTPWSQRPFND
jgi:DNA-binding transcriptional ArsR family regulator